MTDLPAPDEAKPFPPYPGGLNTTRVRVTFTMAAGLPAHFSRDSITRYGSYRGAAGSGDKADPHFWSDLGLPEQPVGPPVDCPSYIVAAGDVVSVRETEEQIRRILGW